MTPPSNPTATAAPTTFALTERDHIDECQSWIDTAHFRLGQGDVAATEAALLRATEQAHLAATMRAGQAAKR